MSDDDKYIGILSITIINLFLRGDRTIRTAIGLDKQFVGYTCCWLHNL